MRNGTRKPPAPSTPGKYRFSNHTGPVKVLVGVSDLCDSRLFSVGFIPLETQVDCLCCCSDSSYNPPSFPRGSYPFTVTRIDFGIFSVETLHSSSASANNSSIRFKTPPAASSIKWKKLFRGAEAGEQEFSDEDKENGIFGSDGGRSCGRLKFQRGACTTSKKRIHFRRRRPGEAAEDEGVATGGLKPCSVFTPLNKLK